MMIVGAIAGMVIVILGLLLLIAGVIKLQSPEAITSGFLLIWFGVVILAISLPIPLPIDAFPKF